MHAFPSTVSQGTVIALGDQVNSGRGLSTRESLNKTAGPDTYAGMTIDAAVQHRISETTKNEPLCSRRGRNALLTRGLSVALADD